MTIYYGNTLYNRLAVSQLNLGGTAISKVFLGTNQIHPPILPSPVSPGVPVTSGLVVNYDGRDSVTSGYWVNRVSSGSSFNARVGPTPVSKLNNNALDLYNGVAVSNNAPFNGVRQNFTLLVMFNTQTLPPPDNSSAPARNVLAGFTVVQPGPFQGPNQNGLGICVSSPNYVTVSLENTFISFNSFPIVKDTWYMAGLTFELSTNMLSLYLNGVVANFGPITAQSSVTPLVVGSSLYQSTYTTTSYGRNYIRGVYLYNRILSVAEMNQVWGYEKGILGI